MHLYITPGFKTVVRFTTTCMFVVELFSAHAIFSGNFSLPFDSVRDDKVIIDLMVISFFLSKQSDLEGLRSDY